MNEGAGTGPVSLQLTITPGAGSTGTATLARDVTLNVTTAAGGTATGGGTDFTLPGLVTFSAGALNGATQTANLAVTNDRFPREMKRLISVSRWGPMAPAGK